MKSAEKIKQKQIPGNGKETHRKNEKSGGLNEKKRGKKATKKSNKKKSEKKKADLLSGPPSIRKLYLGTSE